MSKFKTRSTLIALSFAALPVRHGPGPDAWTNSANYNGYGAANMNTASNYSMRDANGNLTMVNGQLQPSDLLQRLAAPVRHGRSWHGRCSG